MCDYPTAQLREADPEHPESVARSAGEFRVPLSREHVACPPRVRGWGSSRPVLPPRSAGVHLPPAGSLKDFLTSAVSVPGQGLLERFGRGPGPSPRPLPRDQSFPAVHILARSLTGPLQGSGSMASGECVCACVEGRVSGTEKCRFPGGQEGGGGVLGAGGSVSAQPADLGNEASSSWGGPRKAEPECGKTEGSEDAGVSQTPEKPQPPGLPAILLSRFFWTVEFSQDRLLPSRLGFSVLLYPTRAGLPWDRGSDREEKRGFCPRGAGCSLTAPAMSRMCFEFGGARCGFLFVYFFFPPRLAGPASLDFESLTQSPGKGRGLQVYREG